MTENELEKFMEGIEKYQYFSELPFCYISYDVDEDKFQFSFFLQQAYNFHT